MKCCDRLFRHKWRAFFFFNGQCQLFWVIWVDFRDVHIHPHHGSCLSTRSHSFCRPLLAICETRVDNLSRVFDRWKFVLSMVKHSICLAWKKRLYFHRNENHEDRIAKGISCVPIAVFQRTSRVLQKPQCLSIRWFLFVLPTLPVCAFKSTLWRRTNSEYATEWVERSQTR